MTTTRRRSGVVLLGTALTLLVAGPAAAHVTANPSSTAAGGYAVVDLRVPHGCDGEPTRIVEVQVPDGVTSVKPEQVPGWTAATEIGPYAEPVELHGETLTEGVKVVTWTAADGQELPDGQFRDFGLSVKFPDAPGETLVFPAIQTCADGSEEAWIETSDDPDAELDFPAPTITLTAGDGQHGDAATTDAEEEPVASDDAELATSTPATAEGSNTDPLVFVALAVGVLGLVAGAAGLRAARTARH